MLVTFMAMRYRGEMLIGFWDIGHSPCAEEEWGGGDGQRSINATVRNVGVLSRPHT